MRSCIIPSITFLAGIDGSQCGSASWPVTKANWIEKRLSFQGLINNQSKFNLVSKKTGLSFNLRYPEAKNYNIIIR